MKTPSLEEQLLVEEYVLDRPIYRPTTDAKKAIKCTLLYILITLVFAFSSYFVLSKQGVFFCLPNNKFFNFLNNNTFWRGSLYVLLCFVITGIFSLRMAMIGAIKLYQHYADEEIRRRCVCKPTCSEYAIIVLKKYGVLIGTYMIYIRLFKTCFGTIYKIDEPKLFKKEIELKIRNKND